MVKISYDTQYRLAMFQGPGGFTQVPMDQRYAEGIAISLGVPFSFAPEHEGDQTELHHRIKEPQA